MKVRKLAGKSGSGWVALTGLLSSMGAGAPAWAAPVVLDEVALESTSEGLRIELRGDGAMPAEAVNMKTDDGVVYLYVRGTRVHADRRSWPSELGVIKAHRHHNEIELVVPTGGRTCAASPSFETTQTGLTAVLTCSPGASSTGEARRASRAAAKAAAAAAAAAADTSETRPKKAAPTPTVVDEEVVPSRTVGARAEKPVRGADRAPTIADVPNLAEVKAMVALPAEPKAEPPAAAKSAPLQPAPSGVAAAPSKSAANLAAAADTTATPTETAAAPSSEKEAGAAMSAPAPSENGGHGLLPAFLVLIAGAGGAALWWKKKRGLGLPKRIQIRETASLGPKRSLVVAEIDGERVILASSEAGITVLQPPASAESFASPPAPGLAWAATAAASPRTERAQGQPEAAVAPSILSATTALFASPESTPPRAESTAKESGFGAEIASAARDQIDELEGAASGLARLRSLTGGLATKPPAKGPAASLKASNAFANKAPSASAGQAASAFASKAPSAVAMKDNDRLDDDWFDEILEDSVEDQELRAKLAAGVGGRVK